MFSIFEFNFFSLNEKISNTFSFNLRIEKSVCPVCLNPVRLSPRSLVPAFLRWLPESAGLNMAPNTVILKMLQQSSLLLILKYILLTLLLNRAPQLISLSNYTFMSLDQHPTSYSPWRFLFYGWAIAVVLWDKQTSHCPAAMLGISQSNTSPLFFWANTSLWLDF